MVAGGLDRLLESVGVRKQSRQRRAYVGIEACRLVVGAHRGIVGRLEFGRRRARDKIARFEIPQPRLEKRSKRCGYGSQEMMLRQSEKLATLGTLAAGVAHRLDSRPGRTRFTVRLPIEAT